MSSGESASTRSTTFPEQPLRASMTTFRVQKPGTTGAIHYPSPQFWSARSADSASGRVFKWSLMTRMPKCTPAGFGGCCAGSGTTPLLCSMADSRNGSRKTGRFNQGMKRPPHGNSPGHPRAKWWVEGGGGGGALTDRPGLIRDARAPERYRGDVEPVDKVAGRIPGAVNYFYKWNVGENGAFLTAPQLRDRLEKLVGGVPPERVIGYCGSGVTACQVLLAFEHAGLHGPRLYPGSWSEWLS